MGFWCSMPGTPNTRRRGLCSLAMHRSSHDGGVHMSQPPFRAEHVGSLLRPPALLALRHADHTDEELRAAEDAAILDAIAFQEGVGLQSITDGEFRREKYFTHFAQAVDGFGRAPGSITFHDESGKPMIY